MSDLVETCTEKYCVEINQGFLQMKTEQENIFNQAASGTGWTIGGGFIARLLQFAVSVCLARLLTPELFGRMAMVLVFVGLLEIATHVGLGLALIQRKNVRETHRSTSFWLQTFVGLLLTILFYWTAPWLNYIYGASGLAPVARVMALVFVLSGLYGTHEALLRRRMQFKYLAGLEIGSTLLAGVLAVGLAVSGGGVWSLVCFHFGLNLFEALFAILGVEWSPRLSFDLTALSELFEFSLAYLGSKVFIYGVRTGDDLLVGRVLGANSLGLYSRAYSLVTLPYRRITKKIRKVMLPALSRVQESEQTFRELYLNSLRLIGYTVFPILIGLWVVAEPFVVGLFGSHWQGMVPLVRILVLFGLISSLTATFRWVLLARGHSTLNFVWQLISGGLILVGFVLGVFWGTSGVAWGLVAASLLAIPAGLFFLRRVLELSLFRMFRALSASLVLTLVMAGSVWGLQQYLPGRINPAVQLAVAVSFGAGLYWGGSVLFALRGYEELKRIFTRREAA